VKFGYYDRLSAKQKATYDKSDAVATVAVPDAAGLAPLVVRFRTFLRTLLHEVMHHLDVTLLGLEDSFHTPGFFRRESSLVRQLVARPRPKATKALAPKPVQLALFETGARR
jgi:hypothetical protein